MTRLDLRELRQISSYGWFPEQRRTASGGRGFFHDSTESWRLSGSADHIDSSLLNIQNNCWINGDGMMEREIFAIGRDVCRAIRPDQPNGLQP